MLLFHKVWCHVTEALIQNCSGFFRERKFKFKSQSLLCRVVLSHNEWIRRSAELSSQLSAVKCLERLSTRPKELLRILHQCTLSICDQFRSVILSVGTERALLKVSYNILWRRQYKRTHWTFDYRIESTIFLCRLQRKKSFICLRVERGWYHLRVIDEKFTNMEKSLSCINMN